MFQGIVIDKDETGQQARLQTLDDAQLPAGNVTIRVGYSTLNYKDGLAITGKLGGPFPMVPGIDLVGEVEASTHPDYRPGDRPCSTAGASAKRIGAASRRRPASTVTGWCCRPPFLRNRRWPSARRATPRCCA